MRKLELDHRTRCAFSDRTDLRLEQPIIKIRPLLSSHTRDYSWTIVSVMTASELQYAAIGLCIALAPAIAGLRTIAPVAPRMKQQGNSCDGHFICCLLYTSPSP